MTTRTEKAASQAWSFAQSGLELLISGLQADLSRPHGQAVLGLG